MPSLLRGNYGPPGVYDQTLFGSAPTPTVVPASIPVYVGTGQETLTRSNLALARGSSATIDTAVTEEDEGGRAVVRVNPDGSVTLGAFDGTLQSFQVRNFPLVSGDGTASLALDVSAVTVTVNGDPVVVLSLNAAKGLVELSVAPLATDHVRCSYYFDRTDTLATDNVSAQVTTTAATVDGQVGQFFEFTRGFNDTFLVSVDGGPFVTITFPSSTGSISAAVAAATINGTVGIGSLVATTFVNNYGLTAIRLTADRSLVIGSGPANTVLGFVAGTATARNRSFVVFNGPIVTGNGGGVTTTNPSDVTVLVNGVQVVPTAVDGATRTVTLPYAPTAGSTVTIRYWWNTWQDTFDYLANTGITRITTVGLTPDASTASTYVNGVSYVLKDDRILWGTASLVSAGLHTEGATTFGPTQVTASLVDNRVFLDPCEPTVDTTGPVSVASKTVFQLNYQPTTGNGRGNPLGAAGYNAVSNGRYDLPTTQPALVTAYWGYDFTDALTRGPVSVVKVDPTLSQITLGSPVPEGAKVFATYYYSTVVDQAFVGSSAGYTLTAIAPGAGGIGTYGVTNGSGAPLYGITLAGKGSALSSVTVVFPSGSEFFPDARIENGTPVEETVTVQFASTDPTPARFVSTGASPYYFVDNLSDHLRVTIDGSDQQTGIAAGIDLANPTGAGRYGAFASLVGSEVQYTASSGETTYDIVTGVNDTLNLLVDNVPLVATAGAATGATVANYVAAINAAAVASGNEPYYVSAGAFPNGYTVALHVGDTLRLHYTGATSGASGVQTVTLVPGTYATVAALATQINTQLATINGGGGLHASVTCTPTADSKLRFTLTLAAGDASGYLEFLEGALVASHGSATGTTVLGTANLEPGNTLVVSIDGAGPVTTTFTATAGTITGVGATFIPALGGPATMALTLSGTTITLNALGSEASLSDYITTFNTDGSNAAFQALAVASNAGGQLRITTLRRGSGAGVAVGLGNAGFVTAIGFGSPTLSPGTGNVSNIDAVTGSEIVTAVSTAIGGAGTAALDGGNHFYLQSSTTGASSTVQFTAGLVTTALGLDTAVHAGIAATAASDFAVPAGIDTASTTNGVQTKLYNGPIARRYTVVTGTGRLPYDRIVLRNRIFPGSGSVNAAAVLAQTGLRSLGGTAAVATGLPAGAEGTAVYGAVVGNPTLLGDIGWGSGQAGAQPAVVFYDGSDPLNPANNVFLVTVNGQTLTVVFTASGSGTTTALGPVGTSGTVLFQIAAAATAASLSSVLTATPEGAALRLTGKAVGGTSSLVVGSGSANSVLGFTAGDSSVVTPVTADGLASALMSNAAASGSFSSFMLTFASPAVAYFAGRALATVAVDETGSRFLYVQSNTVGTPSSILFKTPSAASALLPGTLLFITAGEGASGRSAINGFFVTSSNPVSGSGSANTSVLNDGVGQDGNVGQTYKDAVTGLRFTILPRAGNLPYPTGSTATISFNVGRTLVTDGNIPTLAIPGLELLVTNTQGVAVGDTALVETFKKDGPEPSVGEVYYVSYEYQKQDFSPKLWSRLSDVVAEYGPVSPDNPLSLAAYLAFLNGNSVIATLQVKKTAGSSTASETAYFDAVDRLAGSSLPGNISPTVLCLLTPATKPLAVYVARHCDVQSGILNRAERTAIFGFASGTLPAAAMQTARATGSTRVRFVYPDIATLDITNVLGVSRRYLVDGRYIAVALTASTTTTTKDVASPWEGCQLIGFTGLSRRLDAVTANQVANAGVTIIEERAPFPRVRHGLTSDMTNVLTQIPTVIQIADEMQKRARSVLGAFIGTKFLPQVLGQIEGQLAEMFKRAIQEQIISAYTGIRVSLDPTDPTAILVEAFYQPVFPLLYIQITFRVSTSG